jgi:hypothetical protein
VVKVFHSTSASYHIYVLHLSDGQTGESLGTVKKECFSEIGVYWREKHFLHFLVFIELRIYELCSCFPHFVKKKFLHFMNSKAHYNFYKNSLLRSILIQLNPVYILTSCSIKANFNIIYNIVSSTLLFQTVCPIETCRLKLYFCLARC